MDPQNPDSFNHRTERLYTGHTYHFVDQKPEGYDPKRHPTLLLIHGFPDLWHCLVSLPRYGWRYQIGPWVRRGCRVIALDMLGYGGTSKPLDPENYSTKKLCADLVALLDLLDIKRVVLIGHDWGSFTVARFALYHPNRLLALVMLSVPYTPPSKEYIPLEEVVRRAPDFGYQLYFASQKSNLEILANLNKFLRLTFSPPRSTMNYHRKGSLENLLLRVPDKKRPCVLNDKELEYYHSQMKQGMFGPLNYYRTSKLRHDEELAYGLDSHLREDLPVLFMWGTKDLTATPFVISKSRKFISKYQDVALEGRGHWVMVEAKDEVTDIIGNWLESLTCSMPGTAGDHHAKL
ncbi:epoxide hydrolase [Pholiota conissans]|uniref:Epoxide hydrolase n=1 Tax=Pholiota conissans TaxID=109636 RepID=A0A9P5Z3Y1_9AGAR|nr:epoxide hydrolase [Pholiota conissans]